MMERYFVHAGLSHSLSLVVRSITHTKHGERLRAMGGLSYTRVRELLIAIWRELRFATDHLGLHSLRAGGASAAANAGVPDHLFKRQGHWRPDTAKDGYIKDSREALMSVSKNLKL